MFITELERKALDPVFMSMAMGSSAERAATMDPSIEGSLYDVYKGLSSACKEARNQMLTEIKKSYNS